jgi:hypothetical protein
MPTLKAKPGFRCKAPSYDGGVVEIGGGSVAFGISLIFHCVDPKERPELLAKLNEIERERLGEEGWEPFPNNGVSLDNPHIQDILLENGFTLKKQPDGSMALNPYVFSAIRAVLAAALDPKRDREARAKRKNQITESNS